MRPLTLSKHFCEKVARISLRLSDASRVDAGCALARACPAVGHRLRSGLTGRPGPVRATFWDH